MSSFINECKNTIMSTQNILKQNTEWIQRYAKYSPLIQKNMMQLTEVKKRFREWKPLHLHMNVSAAKGQMLFGVRFLGQEVAKLKVGEQNITISTADFDKTNKRDFNCDIKLGNDCEWRSESAVDFRRHFSKTPKRTNLSGKGNEEHRLESLLTTEFTKKIATNKLILNIQPVKLFGHARFQMPTPLTASNLNALKYSNANGGGIDIISRIGTGKATKLCIMEVKDENISKEPPTKAIQQGLAYATFIRELLRSESGGEWWKIFGFNGKMPSSLEIYVVCVMPSTTDRDISFAGSTLEIGDDSFHLHYMYFQELDNKLTSITTSLPQCPVPLQSSAGF